jgi:hypothetical protein
VTYGGDSGNRIFVLYWRCPLITVSVIRGSTVVAFSNSANAPHINIRPTTLNLRDEAPAFSRPHISIRSVRTFKQTDRQTDTSPTQV